MVYLLLAMVLFFQSGYGEVWNKLVQGLEWARQFRVRAALGMQPSPAAVTQARQRLGWPVMQRLLEAVAGPLAGEELETAWVAGMRLVALDGMCLDVPPPPGTARSSAIPVTTPARGRSRRSGSSAWVSAGPGRCWGPSCRRWLPGSSRWP